MCGLAEPMRLLPNIIHQASHGNDAHDGIYQSSARKAHRNVYNARRHTDHKHTKVTHHAGRKEANPQNQKKENAKHEGKEATKATPKHMVEESNALWHARLKLGRHMYIYI